MRNTKNGSQERITVHYWEHQGKPKRDVLDFLSLPQFTKRWKELGLNEGEDLAALKLFITANPKGGRPIRGTRGIRKMRFAVKRWNTGKSGAARVLYVHFERFGAVLFCLIYRKSEAENISSAVKNYLNRLVDEQERELDRRGTL